MTAASDKETCSWLDMVLLCMCRAAAVLNAAFGVTYAAIHIILVVHLGAGNAQDVVGYSLGTAAGIGFCMSAVYWWKMRWGAGAVYLAIAVLLGAIRSCC